MTSSIPSRRALAQQAKRSRKDRLYIGGLLSVVGAILVARLTYFVPYTVPSSSMAPTIPVGNSIIVNSMHYKWTPHKEPFRGDIVVFTAPEKWATPNTVMVKRVVAVSGDTVECRNGRLLINGVEESPTHAAEEFAQCNPFPKTKVTEGHFWAMGDNRENSADSTYMTEKGLAGEVPVENLLGKQWLQLPFTLPTVELEK